MTPLIITALAFVGATAIVGMVMFIFLGQSGGKVSERLDTLTGRRKKDDEASSILRKTAFEADRAHAAERPRGRLDDVVASPPQLVEHAGGHRLRVHASWMRLVRSERARKVRRVEHRSVVRRLKVEAEDRLCEEELERPLVLLVAAWGPERDHRLAVAERERWAQCGPRPLATLDAVRMHGVEVEHLRPCAETEAQARDDR